MHERRLDLYCQRTGRIERLRQFRFDARWLDQETGLQRIVAEIDGLVSRDDIQQLAATLNNNSSAGVMLFENTWATRLRDAIVDAQGKVVLIDRIPHGVIEQALAAGVQA